MKKYIIMILSLLTLTFGFVINPAGAKERYRVFEMGESGQTVSFLMSADEIAVENARQAAIRKAKLQKATPRFKVFEMGESGHSVSFALTAAEIAALDAENQDRADRRSAKGKTQKHHTVDFELAESGQVIEFPVPAAQQHPVIDDIEIAQGPAGKREIDTR